MFAAYDIDQLMAWKWSTIHIWWVQYQGAWEINNVLLSSDWRPTHRSMQWNIDIHDWHIYIYIYIYMPCAWYIDNEIQKDVHACINNNNGINYQQEVWNIVHAYSLMQACSNSSTLAMELLQSCIKPSMSWCYHSYKSSKLSKKRTSNPKPIRSQNAALSCSYYSHALLSYGAYVTVILQMAYRVSHKICTRFYHDDVIKWKYFARYWPFVRGIHRSPVNSPHTKASDAELWCFLWSAPE